MSENFASYELTSVMVRTDPDKQTDWLFRIVAYFY